MDSVFFKDSFYFCVQRTINVVITERSLCLGLCIDLEEDVDSRKFSYTTGHYTCPPSLFVAINDLNVQNITKLRCIYRSFFRQTTTEKKIEKIDEDVKNHGQCSRRHTDGQQAHEKTLNISNYQRNPNQNYKYHLTPVKRAIIIKSTNKCQRRCGNKENTSTLLVGMQTGIGIMENILQVPLKK